MCAREIKMKLLICTQKVDKDDPILGFFHRWIEEFAKHCEHIVVIANGVGEYNLPKNVEIYSLGKEKNSSRVIKIFRFVRFSYRLRKEYDAVFVHMIPEFVIAGGVIWRFFKKQVSLWYVHGTVSLRLQAAVFLAHKVFTTSPESCRVKSRKVQSMGHGIDIPKVFPPKKESKVLSVISIGRISPAKQVEKLLEAFRLLKERGVPFTAQLIGGPATKNDIAYANLIEIKAKKLGVDYKGPLPHEEAMSMLQSADIFVSASITGSVDKAVLEAAARRVVPIFSSKAFDTALGVPGLWVSSEGTGAPFADRIQELSNNPNELQTLAEQVHTVVLRKHNLTQLIPKIVTSYQK